MENRAYALWQAVRTGAVRAHGTPANGPARFGLDNAAGHHVEINLAVKMYDLWPDLAGRPTVERTSYTRDIRQFLRASGNAVCVRRPTEGNEPRQLPIWWIRDEWRDVAAVPIFRTLELTYAERRLSVTEAGEDRPAPPVTVHRPQEGSEPVPSTGGTGSGDAPWARLLRERLLQIIKDAAEPLYLVEFQRKVRVNATDTRRALNALIAEGQLHTRQEVVQERPRGINGRHRNLYWHSTPIPRRRSLLPYKSEAMDMVAALAPGEKLPITWMPDVDKDEIRQMAEAGLVEYVDDSRAIQLSRDSVAAKERAGDRAPSTPPTVMPIRPTRLPPTPSVPPAPARIPARSAAPARPPELPGDLAGALSALIEQQVEARVQGMAHRVETLSQQLSEERSARQRLEASLIEARTEASEQRALAEKRATAIKAMLGD